MIMSLDFSLNMNAQDMKNKVSPDTVYDTLIIGGGPAGLNAALYASRKGLSVGLIAGRVGGQVLDTSSVENYLGVKEASGEELAHTFESHVKSYNVPILDDVLVEEIQDGAIKQVKANNGFTYQARSLILTTGSRPRMLGVPGEKEYLGRGVAYCAICDGPLFTGRDVIVAGGGNSAVEAAIDLAKIANTVKLVHRSAFRADKVLVDKLESLENVEIHLQTQILSVHGEMLMSHVRVLDKASGEEREIPAEGLFVEIGYMPKSELFEGLVALNSQKEVIVNSKAETDKPGIFAAGDVTDVPYKQVVISVADGAKAALTANDYINKLK